MVKIKDYGIEEVDALDGAPKVVIIFEGGHKFEGFIFKRDGDPNKKTLKTLFTCGFRGKDLTQLAHGPEGDALDMGKEFELDIQDDENGYAKVEWVIDPDEKRFSDKVDKKKFGGMKLGKALGELNEAYEKKSGGAPKTRPKNYAPGASGSSEPPELDDDEEIIF